MAAGHDESIEQKEVRSQKTEVRREEWNADDADDADLRRSEEEFVDGSDGTRSE
jgi:hypothetical protein